MDADRWERKRERWERRWERRQARFNNPSRHLFSGFVFLAIGLVFLLGNMGFLNVHSILRFWPVILIAGGILKMVESRDEYRTGSGVFWIVVGLLFLMGNFNILRIAFRDLWPVVLIGLGVSMLWRSAMASRYRDGLVAEETPDARASGFTSSGFTERHPRSCAIVEFHFVGDSDPGRRQAAE